MKDIKKRLQQFLTYKKTNSCDIADKTTEAAEVVARFVALYPELNADWLIAGRGPMLYTPAITIPENIKDFADMLDDIKKTDDPFDHIEN